MIKKAFKLLFFFLLAGFLFFLVDFENFSFKTIRPEPKTEIQSLNSPKTGIQRKKAPEIDISVEEKFFEGSEKDIINLANEARKKKDLKPLKKNAKLAASAMEKARHMKKNDYFEHTSPNGLQPWYFAEKVGYQYKTFGENLAEGYFSAESVHEGWMDSKGHRENILSEEFEEIGVAFLEITREDQKSYLIVQHFGTPLTEEDLVKKTICDKDSRENCREAEDKEEKLDKIIDEQEDIIEKAEKEGATEEDLQGLLENLEKLKENEDELEDYLEECEEFIEKCDEWR